MNSEATRFIVPSNLLESDDIPAPPQSGSLDETRLSILRSTEASTEEAQPEHERSGSASAPVDETGTPNVPGIIDSEDDSDESSEEVFDRSRAARSPRIR